MRRTSLLITVTATALAYGATALPAGATPVPTPAPTAMTRTAPAWVAHAHSLGPAADTATVSARVYLAPRGGLAALAAAATAMSTPGSADYHHFLSAAQYRQRFGVTEAGLQGVSSYLRAHGMTVTAVAPGNRYLAVTGTVAGAEHAFGTTIDRYRHGGRTVQAPADALDLPAALASSVLAVTGLDTSTQLSRPASSPAAPPPAGYRNARPCSTYFGQLKATTAADFSTPLPAFGGKALSYAPCGYTGPQLRAAYEGSNPTGLDGSGVSVGIVGAYAAPTIAKDADRYAREHGDGGYAPGQLSQTNAATFTRQQACGASGWFAEQTLDVEAVHAMAPAAGIHYYGAASCANDDLLDALATVVDEDAVRIVSNSYGSPAEYTDSAGIAAEEAVFLQGAAEGISFAFASGDDGDELAATGIKQVDYPTSDPYVTSVGGTSTAIGAGGAIAFQTGWGTDTYALSADGTSWTPGGFAYGGGGGTSTLFNRPAYQAGFTSSPYRQVPDVAMDADPDTGMLVGQTQTFADGRYYDEHRVGGTSLAAPLFAGMTALAVQFAGGKGAGLLDPAVYANAGAFDDVSGPSKQAGDVRVDFVNGVDASGGLRYSVHTFGDDSTLATSKGYDLVTGLGATNSNWLTSLG